MKACGCVGGEDTPLLPALIMNPVQMCFTLQTVDEDLFQMKGNEVLGHGCTFPGHVSGGRNAEPTDMSKPPF